MSALPAETTAAQDIPAGSTAPRRLLLTAQRLRRLKRDRERQTPRWTNFERRLQQAPDSAERGFELALDYRITSDEKRGSEAVRWAAEHPCQIRQIALIRDWVSSDVAMPQANCRPSSGRLAAMRDRALVSGEVDDTALQDLVNALRAGAYRDSQELYAAMELAVLAEAQGKDVQARAPGFFQDLPQLYLLSLPPASIQQPEPWEHISALALVNLEPNEGGAQFLQGWAIEDRQMLTEGPGVAYELLWADPYLPGVGYQNMDPWLLDDDTGVFVAHTDWTPAACWLRISDKGTEVRNCAADIAHQTARFGRLQLMPASDHCIDVVAQTSEPVILWQLRPRQQLRYRELTGRTQSSQATATGVWRVPLNAAGKVCTAR